MVQPDELLRYETVVQLDNIIINLLVFSVEIAAKLKLLSRSITDIFCTVVEEVVLQLNYRVHTKVEHQR